MKTLAFPFPVQEVQAIGSTSSSGEKEFVPTGKGRVPRDERLSWQPRAGVQQRPGRGGMAKEPLSSRERGLKASHASGSDSQCRFSG
jgi:hypothetical protein